MPKSPRKLPSQGKTQSPRRRRGQAPSSPWRLAAFLAIAVMVLGVAGALLKPVVFPDQGSGVVANALPLEISMSGFSQTLV